MDGRWLIVTALTAYFALLVSMQHFVGDTRAWHRLGVPAASPACSEDLLGFFKAAENARRGFDPITGDPNDPEQNTATYPHIWFWPWLVLPSQLGHVHALGVLLRLTFYGCVLLFAGRLDLRGGLVWAALLCLPPAMLAVERSNNDLVIFDLLALALVVRRVAGVAAAGWGYALIGAAALLKLYPFGAFCLALREKPRTAFVVLAAAGAGFAAYLYAIRDQLRAIKSVLPQLIGFSYGSRVFADWYATGHPGVLPGFVPTLAVGVVLLLAGAGWRLAPRLPALPGAKLDGLMVGSVLYAVSFALTNNFNYRLIFQLFALPGVLHLLGERGFYRRVAVVTLTAWLVGWTFSCWFWPGWSELCFFPLKELANWIVFAGMVFLGLQCLPPLRGSTQYHASAQSNSSAP